MNIDIRKCILSITSEGKPYQQFKIACYRDIPDVQEHALESGTVHGNMDVWYRLDSEEDTEDAATYTNLGVLDAWIDIETPAKSIDVMFLLDADDPLMITGFIPTLIGRS